MKRTSLHLEMPVFRLLFPHHHHQTWSVETTDKVVLFVPPTIQETQCPLSDQTLNFGEKTKIFLILGWTFCFKILSTQPWVSCYNLHFNLRSSGFCRDTPLRRTSLWMSILIFNIVKYYLFISPQFNIYFFVCVCLYLCLCLCHCVQAPMKTKEDWPV